MVLSNIQFFFNVLLIQLFDLLINLVSVLVFLCLGSSLFSRSCFVRTYVCRLWSTRLFWFSGILFLDILLHDNRFRINHSWNWTGHFRFFAPLQVFLRNGKSWNLGDESWRLGIVLVIDDLLIVVLRISGETLVHVYLVFWTAFLACFQRSFVW